MSENVTALRQAINTVNICGYLKKMDLSKGTGKSGDYISGNLIIETAPHNEIRVDTYANKMTKPADGKPAEETAAYKGLLRVMEEYESMATLMERDKLSEDEARERCTKISAGRARLTLNEYYDRTDNLNITVRANSSFFSRVNGEFDPGARFDIEGYVDSKKPEIKNGEETGRLLLDLIVPAYGGAVMPMSFVVCKESADYIENHYTVGSTVRVYGNMVNSVNIIKIAKPGIRVEYETQTTYVNELLIDNGLPEPYDEENPNSYKREAILAAMRVRETEHLPQLKERQKEAAAKKNNSGASAGFASGSAPKSSSPFSWGAK